jgi:anaerobic magnesium-protoporphyrin IX monomethyl ester cyclase
VIHLLQVIEDGFPEHQKGRIVKEMKKAILIEVGNDYVRDEWGLVVSPPLSILSVGSYLAAHDVPVELIDMQMDFGFGLTHEIERTVCQRIAQYLHDQADDIAWIGISQHSNAVGGVTLAQEIHNVLPETPIVFGGYFPSSCYRLLLEKYPFITAIVRGDGEAAALEISQSLAQDRSFLSARTPNLAWREGEKILANPVQPTAVAELPTLNLSLLRNRTCYQTLSLLTIRGCPFACNYCLESNMRPYSEYPLDWVAQQLAHLKTELPDRRYIFIADPIFGLNRKRTLELCRVMQEYHCTYSIESRVDVLDPALIPSLRQAGIEIVYLGMESASVATLLRMNKVRSEAEAKRYVEKAMQVLKACFENDLVPFLGFMAAFPGDSEDDCRANLEFVKKAKLLRDQVTTRTGIETPFSPSTWHTHIFAGTPLAERLAEDFPEVGLQPEPFDGEWAVVSPSLTLDMDTVRHYWEQLDSFADYTPRVLELVDRYFGSSSKLFREAHPELTDSQDVTVFCDGVKQWQIDKGLWCSD